jgi:hypothetical protein
MARSGLVAVFIGESASTISDRRINMTLKKHRLATILGFGTALLTALAGCSDTDDRQSEGDAPPTSPAGESGAAGAPSDTPRSVYALTTQVFGETENQSYVLLTAELAADTQLSLDDAVVEIAGRALGSGPENGGVLFAASELAPTITRYELTADGKLAGGDSVSFLGKGITKFGESISVHLRREGILVRRPHRPDRGLEPEDDEGAERVAAAGPSSGKSGAFVQRRARARWRQAVLVRGLA